MASPAHAFYCFEVLAASYSKSDHLDLQTVEALYQEYIEHTQKGEGQQPNIQVPSISRLQNLSSSSSSSTSTPSSASVNSSNTQLTTPSSEPASEPTYASRLSVTESYPLFVTWNTISKSSGHKSLRGCIGTFSPMPLEKGLESYALTSAFEDTRFSPIPEHALPSLSCSLTLLADFEDCEDGPMDWELGKNGIRIKFQHQKRSYSATYLPDVAVEQGWTKEETLESLMRKSGWEPQGGVGRRMLRGSAGPTKPWEEVKDFRVIRYTGLKASAKYAEWDQWRSWLKEKKPELFE